MEYMQSFGTVFGGLGGFAIAPFALLILLWSVVWKGLALWAAARRGEKIWFVVLFVVNTLGILEIVYIYLVAKRNPFARSGEAALSSNN